MDRLPIAIVVALTRRATGQDAGIPGLQTPFLAASAALGDDDKIAVKPVHAVLRSGLHAK